MAVYKGRCKSLVDLARTNISQETFDFVTEVGYTSMMGYINEDPWKVLVRQFKLWFDRCPDLLEEFESIFTDEWTGIYQSRIDEDKTIQFILDARAQFIIDVVSVGYLYVCPLFLKNFIDRVKKENAENRYKCSMGLLANYYFDEIKNSIRFMEMMK